MSNIAIRVEGLGKQYRIAHLLQRHDTLRDALAHAASSAVQRVRHGRLRQPRSVKTIWALRDISFEVQRGEVVGIIGANGAGKSTLLKILSRITEPTVGEAEVRGRVGSLLEVGTGFNWELSGRENIYLNGAILGMKRAEINRKFDEIVAFSEVEKFIDTPVKHYSSGMYLRLAFAVAAHLEPEILIVDEVLAVGDAAFQKKCLGKMSDVAHEGRTVLFVSHNLAAVRALCHSVVLLEKGKISERGSPREVISSYLRGIEQAPSVPLSLRSDRSGTGAFQFESVEILNESDDHAPFPVTGDDLLLRLRIRASRGAMLLPVPLDVAVHIRDSDGYRVTTLCSFFTGASLDWVEHTFEVACEVPRLPLLAGQYRLDLWCGVGDESHDEISDAATLQVAAGDYFRNGTDVRLPVADLHGCCMIPQRWIVPSPASSGVQAVPGRAGR